MKLLKKKGYIILKAENIEHLNKVKKEYVKLAKRFGFDGTPKGLNKISENVEFRDSRFFKLEHSKCQRIFDGSLPQFQRNPRIRGTYRNCF